MPDALSTSSSYLTGAGGIDYEALRKAITDAATRTRQVALPTFNQYVPGKNGIPVALNNPNKNLYQLDPATGKAMTYSNAWNNYAKSTGATNKMIGYGTDASGRAVISTSGGATYVVDRATGAVTPTAYVNPSTLTKSNKIGQDISTLNANPTEDLSAIMPWYSMHGANKFYAEGILSDYELAKKTTQEQADKAATGLEIEGANTINYLQSLGGIQDKINAQVSSASDMWNKSIVTADKYIQDAKGRADSMLKQLDVLNNKVTQDMDFAKAHEMQAAVQGTLGSLRDTERSIAQQYGIDSKEYASVAAGRLSTIATIHSNINASYDKIKAEQGQTYLNAATNLMGASSTAVGYAELNSINTLNLAAENSAAYAMQSSQMEVAIEGLKAGGLENIANWIIQTPVFSVNAAPYISALWSIRKDQKSMELAQQMADQSKPMGFGEQLGLAAMSGIAGGLTGGMMGGTSKTGGTTGTAGTTTTPKV